ncbi:CDP-glycerol glycerophosphotransferase family protein [Bacteroidales bacterium OttesenSCG-928-M11]|nr:CDP-glycerol glycerophosphotransferase family protein [Bacteroidales bacterium OttesenSCG-928-M11]
MQQDKQFNPMIFVCPVIVHGDEHMHTEMERTFNYFISKGYPTHKTYDNGWINIKKEFSLDLIFYSSPHELTKKQYFIKNYQDILSCHIPYNFGNSKLLHSFHDKIFHNLLWKLFAESEIHKQYSINTARNRGINVDITGYPGVDSFFDKNYISQDNWKIKDKKVKRIIWAPHFSIGDERYSVRYSSFLTYAEYFFELIDKYKNEIQIAFKPHPVLKNSLYNHPDWGKEKTDAYYNSWSERENSQLEEGEYIDLFITSDAMIHDSGSFLIEYLCLNKPVLRTDRDDTIRERLNSFANMAYDVHYIARCNKTLISLLKICYPTLMSLKIKGVHFKKNSCCLLMENWLQTM